MEVQRTGRYSLDSTHPDLQAMWDITSRIHLLAETLNSKPLRDAASSLVKSAFSITTATSDENAGTVTLMMFNHYGKVANLLGTQLRNLP
jgi:hypothetical protein